MIVRWLNRLEENIFCALLVAMVFLVTIEVFYRFVLTAGISWAQEGALYLSGWFVLFGVSWGVKHGAHIGVDVLVKKLPRRGRRIVTLIALAVCLTYCGLILVGSYEYLKLTHMIGIELQDIPIPKWQATLILPIGMALLVLRFVELGWRVFKDEAEGFGYSDEAEESMHLAEHDQDSPDKEHRS
ncbi:C4-dicarboxylate transporter, DctQ subunit [Modicisalibacter muralis]|uniref:TRAP transporter small permease protein n=1 Tax=Modicisalibacter muralis TaxID=119000 RepID=A0A1G9NQJ3_9GAMM|nr:TRAP transporter small permease [Halomonas muralis]SDL88852.1 C4-dicarboxylate transporter, DctQ subunit [Halomonas muralis]